MIKAQYVIVGDDVAPMTLQIDIQEGTTLYNMSGYVYFGTPVGYAVHSYNFNGVSYDVNNTEGFDCTAQDFSDERRYICIHTDGKLEIRKGSNFKQIAGDSRIEIVIKAYDDENRNLGLCKFEFIIPFKPTLTPPATTTKPPTTASTTKKTTTTTAATTTTKMASTLSISTTPESHKITTLRSKGEAELTTGPDEYIATPPTVDPCLDEKILQERLNQCMPTSVELRTIVINQSLQSVFEYKIDMPVSMPILKTAFVKIGNYSTSLESNSSFAVKVFHGSGESRSLIKSVPAKLKGQKTMVPVDKFVPTRVSRITVEVHKNKKRVSLPGGLVSLGISNYAFCLNDTCLRHYYSWQHHVGKIQCVPILNTIPVAQFDTCFGKSLYYQL